MKVRDNAFFRNIVVRYVKGAYMIRLFGTDRAKEVKDILMNLELEFDDNLSGEAFLTGNKMIVNKNRVFSNNDYDLVFFHEFTHRINCIHNDMHLSDGIFSKFTKFYCDRNNTNFNYHGRILDDGNNSNPYHYFFFGLLLIDEVISEFVAYLIYSYNKGVDLKSNNYSRRIGSDVINYSSHFSYYGIGEKFVELFSKTLFLPKDEKNILGLAKRLMDKDYCYELIYQHFESNSSIRGLFEELCYMGVIAFNEEKYHGHLKERGEVPADLVSYSYNKGIECLRAGAENREIIPEGIVKPNFLN